LPGSKTTQRTGGQAAQVGDRFGRYRE